MTTFELNGTTVTTSDDHPHLLSALRDELAVAECDLGLCANYKDTLFDFGYYRRPEVYGTITAQQGVVVPPDVVAALENSDDDDTGGAT